MPKRTKIVATISALNCEVEFLKQLYEAGMDVARLNTAHMSISEAERTIANIRAVSDKIAIMIDTKGPEVRTMKTEQAIELKCGDVVTISAAKKGGTIEVNYSDFVKRVAVGHRILIDDGELELMIRAKNGDILECEAMNAGVIASYKSVNVPQVALPLPALTAKDRVFIEFAIEQNLDFIAHSFVRSRDDIMAVRSMLETSGSHIAIIAKVENRQSIDNLDSIVASADGVMVARGDLGVEVPLEEVPELQKRIIRSCILHHKPVIIATQMLQSMIKHPRPTRAEVSDVANAVFDGTDAVMLSGETSAGKYPVQAVKMMTNIINQVESAPGDDFCRLNPVDISDNTIRGEVVKFAVQAKDNLGLAAIVGLTQTGISARVAAAHRGSKPVYFGSPDATVVRQLALSYGVYSYHHKYEEVQQKAFRPLLNELLAEWRLKATDLVACIGEFSGGVDGSNNFCCLARVGDLLDPSKP